MSEVRPSIGFVADVGITPRGIIECAREAERAGFAGAWIIEYEYDSLALDQAIATATSRLTTGSAIMRAFTRHPILTAETATLIDALAPGRFVIGLGTGPLQRPDPTVRPQRWGLPWDRPVARMREYIRLVRRALSGEVVDHDGEFYQVHGIRLRLKPATRIPIYVAAGGEQMMRLAGQEADGMFVHMVNEAMTDRAHRVAREAATGAGRSADAVKLTNLLMTCVSRDREAARRALRCYMIDYYLHLPSYQQGLAASGFPDVAKDLAACRPRGDSRRSVDEMLRDAAFRKAVDCLPDALLDTFTLAGTAEECRSRFETFVGWGIDVPILYAFPAAGDWVAGYRAVVEAFAPSGAGRAGREG